MNTTTASTSRITAVVAIALAAIAAAAFGISAEHAPAQQIVKLERVVIEGKRTQATVIAQLPRVVIEGRRVASDASQVAVASAACDTSTVVC